MSRSGDTYWLYRIPEVRTVLRKQIVQALERNRCNQVRAARELRVHRNTLHKLIAKLDIRVNP